MTRTSLDRHLQVRRALVTAVAATAMAVSGIVAISAPAHGATPTLTANKTSDLVYTGDTLSVSGTGFAAGTTLNVTVCDENDEPPAGCDMESAWVRNADVGSGGTFTVTLPVRANNGIRDCRDEPVTCAVAVSNATVHTDRSQDAWLPITFAAEVAPQPTLTLSTSAVEVGTTITVTGTKFPTTAATLTLRICATSPDSCDTANAQPVSYDGSGGFTTNYQIKALSFGAVDCAAAACRIGVATTPVADARYDATAPITVAVTPVGSPKLTLSKTAVKIGDSVTLTGTDFPNTAELLWVAICADPPTATNCDTRLDKVSQITYNGSGGFVAQFTVKALSFGSGAGTVDCATTACVIGTSNANAPKDTSYNATAKITVSTEPVETGPRLALSKSKVKVGDTVTLVGTKYPKTAKSLYVTICADPPSATNCDMTLANIGQISYDGSGGFTSRYQVKTLRFPTHDGVIACAKVQCVIGTTNALQPKDRSFNATAKITADTSAPAAKAPSKAKIQKVKVRGKGQKRTVVITWTKAKTNGARVTGYLVQVKPGKKAFKVAGSTKAAKSKLAWSKAKAGKTYKFRVVAKSKAGNSTSKTVKVRIRR
jgi:hypothetical protein